MKTIRNEEILSWLSRALKPLLRIVVQRGIKLNDLIEVVKMSLVEIAHEELRPLASVSDSKVSAMTGVHRRDVKRLHPEQPKPKQAQDIISRVMAQWQLDPEFLDSEGNSRSLAVEGRESEFAKLVSKLNGADISPYAVLYEMERLGIVSKENGQIRLLWTDFVVEQDVHQALHILNDDLQDLITSVTQNLEAVRQNAPRNLHLKTEFDNIPLRELPNLQNWILKEGSRFHARVRARLGQADRDISGELSTGEGRGRIAFCTFALNQVLETV